jgi:gamma-glutamylcyclotransferase (GGCT)/AIG2-like uncharacterized protein YtfP
LTANIFTYGSLMFERVWQRVVRGRYGHHRAVLKGWRRLSIRGREYPGAIPGAGWIEGVLWLRVSASDVGRLDRFEGVEYSRTACTVEGTGPSGAIKAYIYRFRDAHCHRLMERPWDAAAFERIGVWRFLRQYPGFSTETLIPPAGRRPESTDRFRLRTHKLRYLGDSITRRGARNRELQRRGALI